MDINNQLLRDLLVKTDEAFNALMEDPSSAQLQLAYDEAKHDLDHYVVQFKYQLQQKQRQR